MKRALKQASVSTEQIDDRLNRVTFSDIHRAAKKENKVEKIEKPKRTRKVLAK